MSQKFEMKRTFNAPRELVFKAFTEAEHLKNWWGPKGWLFEVSKFDLRPEGVFRYSQQSPDGNIMWVKFVYIEIKSPEKLIYTNCFTDENGKTIRAPFNDNWPLEILNTLSFTEHEGKTTLSMTVEPVSPSKEEVQTFEASLGIFQEGFGGTFDQLASYLSKR